MKGFPETPYTSRFLPEDGVASEVTPPGFVWPPWPEAQKYQLEIWPARPSREGKRDEAIKSPTRQSRYGDGAMSGLKEPVFALESTLLPGKWLWRYRALDKEGKVLHASRKRKFEIPADAKELPMPSSAVLAEKLTGLRPRILFTQDSFERLKEEISKDGGCADAWREILEIAQRAAEVPVPSEPEGYKDGKRNVTEWRKIYTAGKRASAFAARFAFVYRITGEKRWLDLAKAYALAIASWDPLGITSHRTDATGNDEASMPILERLSWVYDWLYHDFTDDEREAIKKAMRARGNDVMDVIRRKDYIAKPFGSHEGRVIGFLGQAGLAFYGEFPDAEEWLRYAVLATLTFYPFWGGRSGGWAQGLAYWSAYAYWLIQWAFVLDRALGVNLFSRAWFHNTGYLGLYTHPHYATYGGFGDGADRPPSLSEKLLIRHLARRFKDPHLAWHAQKIKSVDLRPGRREWREFIMEDFEALVQEFFYEPVEGKPLKDLPQSRHFADVGWAAMHSEIGDAQDDVWVLFKSSPYGSFSHSHADQNSFILSAYGEPLLISSGYYPYYSSPHHRLCARASRAQNLVLVNGHGQAQESQKAPGIIEHFAISGDFVEVRGEAGWGYNVRPSETVETLEKKYLREGEIGPRVEVDSFKRRLIFARRPRVYVVIHDTLLTQEPATFQWLLHSLEKMVMDEERGEVEISRGEARLLVRLVSHSPLRFSQTDRFVAPPEEQDAQRPNQWHSSFKTEEPSAKGIFLAILVPFKAGEPRPEIKRIEAEGALAFEVAGQTILASLPETAEISFQGARIASPLAILSPEGKVLLEA